LVLEILFLCVHCGISINFKSFEFNFNLAIELLLNVAVRDEHAAVAELPQPDHEAHGH